MTSPLAACILASARNMPFSGSSIFTGEQLIRHPQYLQRIGGDVADKLLSSQGHQADPAQVASVNTAPTNVGSILLRLMRGARANGVRRDQAHKRTSLHCTPFCCSTCRVSSSGTCNTSRCVLTTAEGRPRKGGGGGVQHRVKGRPSSTHDCREARQGVEQLTGFCSCCGRSRAVLDHQYEGHELDERPSS